MSVNDESIDVWKRLCCKLARHIRNTDNVPITRWTVLSANLLVEMRAIDAQLYDQHVIGFESQENQIMTYPLDKLGTTYMVPEANTPESEKGDRLEVGQIVRYNSTVNKHRDGQNARIILVNDITLNLVGYGLQFLLSDGSEDPSQDIVVTAYRDSLTVV